MTDHAPTTVAVSASLLLTNAPTILHGDSGSGKSWQATELADYIWERSGELFGTKHRRVLRYIAVDSGGYPARVAAMARYGVIELWRCRNHRDPTGTCEYMTRGFWPAVIDQTTGLADDDVPLVPPVLSEFTQVCPTCQTPVARVTLPEQLIARKCRCGAIVPATSVRTVKRPNPAFAHVGGLFIDGLTSMQDWIGVELSEMQAHGTLKGEQAALGGVVESAGLKFAGTNRAQIGFAQLRAQIWCANAATIPGVIVPTHFTALEDRGGDESKQPIYGPKIAGSARTYMVPQWVGHCLFLSKVDNPAFGDGKEYRLYFTDARFADEGYVPHLAKTRAEPGTFPEFWNDLDTDGVTALPPGTWVSLKRFYRRLDEALDTLDQTFAARYANVAAERHQPEEAVLAITPVEHSAVGAVASAVAAISAAIDVVDAATGAGPTPGLPASATPAVTPIATAPPARRGRPRRSDPPRVVPPVAAAADEAPVEVAPVEVAPVEVAPVEVAPATPAEVEPPLPFTPDAHEAPADSTIDAASDRPRWEALAAPAAPPAAAPPSTPATAAPPAASRPAALPQAAPRRPRGLPTVAPGPRVQSSQAQGVTLPPPVARPDAAPPKLA